MIASYRRGSEGTKITSYAHGNAKRQRNKARKTDAGDQERTKRTMQLRMEYDYSQKQRTAKTSSSNKGRTGTIRCQCGGACNKAGKAPWAPSVQRLRCVICKRYQWIHMDPNHATTIFQERGLILEQICRGMSLRSAGSTLRNIKSRTYTASGVLAVMRNELLGLRLVVDDIESSLGYGKRWSIDESIICSRKKNTAGSEKDTHKIYLLGIIDTETKMLVKISAYDSRPKKGTIADFLVDAAKKVGKPRVITSDCYAAYAPAIRMAFGASMIHEKRNLRREGLHNNEIERFWKTIKSELLVSSGRRFSSAQDIRKYIELYATYYNHIRIHSTIKATPAVCAGYDGKTIETFADLLEMSHKPDILFVSKLGRLAGMVHVYVESGRVAVSPRTDNAKVWTEINRTLLSCGFHWSSSKRWILDTDGFDLRRERIERRTGRKAALKPFATCTHCKVSFFSRQDVEKHVGYFEARDGCLIPQSRCKKCRSIKQELQQASNNGAATLDMFFPRTTSAHADTS